MHMRRFTRLTNVFSKKVENHAAAIALHTMYCNFVGAFEIAHYRPKARPNSVCVAHPKTDEKAWWPLFDENGKDLFPELMPELNAIKEQTVSGLGFRRDHTHRRGRGALQTTVRQ
jgi:hypothetical protein